MPDARYAIPIKDQKGTLRFDKRGFLPKDMEESCVANLGPVERSKPDFWARRHATPCFLRMPVDQKEGDEEAAVCVDRQ